MNHTHPAHGTEPKAVRRLSVLTPTQTRQSWLFIIGGSMFAIGSAASIWGSGQANFTNIICFVGAWFFTAAGLIQLVLSGDMTTKTTSGTMFRAAWLAAAIQSFGTIMFNISTSASLSAKDVDTEKHFVWNPDAGGSVAFLLSAVFVYIAYYRTSGKWWDPMHLGWWGAHINMIGCIAFGVSAVGSFVLNDGSSADNALANWGTFIGAICFVLASFLALPQLSRSRAT